jgi:hypothetical protein
MPKTPSSPIRDELEGHELVPAVETVGQRRDLALGEPARLQAHRLEGVVAETVSRASPGPGVVRELHERVARCVSKSQDAHVGGEKGRLEVGVVEPHVGEGEALAGSEIDAPDQRPTQLRDVGAGDAAVQLVSVARPHDEPARRFELHPQVRQTVRRQPIAVGRPLPDTAERATAELLERCERRRQLVDHVSPGDARVASTSPWNRKARSRS